MGALSASPLTELETFFVKKLDNRENGAIVIAKELENSVISGSCHRHGDNFQKLFRLEDGCTRKDRRTTDDVFSTSASLFFCLRENRLEKINHQSVTLSSGGYNARG